MVKQYTGLYRKEPTMSKEKPNNGNESWTTVQFCPVFLEKEGKYHAALMQSISLKSMKIKPGVEVNGDSLNSGDTVVFEVKTPYGKSEKYNGRIERSNGTEESQDCYVDFSNTMFTFNDPIMSLIDSPF
jgi:hypothetical protein